MHTHPQFLAKLKAEHGENLENLANRTGLDMLQVAMTAGGFNLPFAFPPPAAYISPPAHMQPIQPQPVAATSAATATAAAAAAVAVASGSGSGNQATSSGSSHSSESSQSSSRNVVEPRESSSGFSELNNLPSTSQQQQPQQQPPQEQQQSTNWSFEEQFKQVR
ncbi:hemiasterlin resistant protein 1-like [Frieseomelitta varia]|uniref:hemiasterlin resistant protein 1-like n=1 Tax=Frieseomelitta varia TaxID=561572 RepID=UPI001CB6A52F|nr:hemiasterlin resistant protein 1-like [Frieseomelitta varia]